MRCKKAQDESGDYMLPSKGRAGDFLTLNVFGITTHCCCLRMEPGFLADLRGPLGAGFCLTSSLYLLTYE